MGIRKAAKSIGEFLAEGVFEAVGEVILTILACALLTGLVFVAYLSWTFSPRLTLAAAALLSLTIAHGAWRTIRRTPAKPAHGKLAAITTTVFTATALTALYLIFYATDCSCL